jgi:cell division septal protein FtsQ
MDTTVTRKSDSHIKDKLFRFKPITFLRKYMVLFLFILFLVLSTVLGLWNIKKYEITEVSNLELNAKIQKDISNFIEEKIIGKNYFTLPQNKVEKEMVSAISYIKSVSITKMLPNRVDLLLEIYEPEIVAMLKENRCYLLSEDGFVLESICGDEGRECCVDYSSSNSLYILNADLFDISTLDNGKEKLLYMDNLSKAIKVVKSLGYEIQKIQVGQESIEITLSGKQLLRFSITQDLELQLSRLIAVMAKIKSDNISFKSLDLRFERPVMKK